MTECVPVPSSEHVAEIVGRQEIATGTERTRYRGRKRSGGEKKKAWRRRNGKQGTLHIIKMQEERNEVVSLQRNLCGNYCNLTPIFWANLTGLQSESTNIKLRQQLEDLQREKEEIIKEKSREIKMVAENTRTKHNKEVSILKNSYETQLAELKKTIDSLNETITQSELTSINLRQQLEDLQRKIDIVLRQKEEILKREREIIKIAQLAEDTRTKHDKEVSLQRSIYETQLDKLKMNMNSMKNNRDFYQDASSYWLERFCESEQKRKELKEKLKEANDDMKITVEMLKEANEPMKPTKRRKLCQ